MPPKQIKYASKIQKLKKIEITWNDWPDKMNCNIFWEKKLESNIFG